MSTQILVVAELHEGHVRKSTHSAITFARATGLPFAILVVGATAKAAAAEVTGFGATKVIAAEDAKLANPVCEAVAPTIAAIAKSGGFDVIATTASSFGKDVAPRVAAKLSAGYAPDISGGNAYGLCEITTPVQVVSVRQSEFQAAEPSGGASPVESVAATAPDAAAARVEFLGLEAAKSERPDLGEARVIISGGRALKEKFAEVLDPLANLLGAAVGASRAACDAGYAPPELQVGQTGRVVAPQLYVAIGISGAIQHLAGMKSSKTIVAINKDPDAPIFQVADYGLVADLFVAVPELVAELKKQA
jgi:electron transfer flavoprotein alpha subunit